MCIYILLCDITRDPCERIVKPPGKTLTKKKRTCFSHCRCTGAEDVNELYIAVYYARGIILRQLLASPAVRRRRRAKDNNSACKTCRRERMCIIYIYIYKYANVHLRINSNNKRVLRGLEGGVAAGTPHTFWGRVLCIYVYT